MERFDDQLKRMAREEDAPLPAWAAGCIQDALDSLPEKRKKRGVVFKYFGTALAACLALFIALPNLSAGAAETMRAIPVVGELVELVTFRTYVREDEYHQARVEIPTVETGGSGAIQNSVDTINQDVETLTQTLIDQFETGAADLGDQAHTALEIRHRVVTNTDRWFTLELEVWQGAGSSNTTYYYYHIDKSTGEIATLSDLFEGDGYVEAISQEILRQMQAENDAGTGMYWIDSEYEDLNFRAIDPDQNFYFDENGDLVIAFDKYEVAPGAAGCPRFTIPRTIYEPYLASD